jgi:hypothetical protein
MIAIVYVSRVHHALCSYTARQPLQPGRPNLTGQGSAPAHIGPLRAWPRPGRPSLTIFWLCVLNFLTLCSLCLDHSNFWLFYFCAEIQTQLGSYLEWMQASLVIIQGRSGCWLVEHTPSPTALQVSAMGSPSYMILLLLGKNFLWDTPWIRQIVLCGYQGH